MVCDVPHLPLTSPTTPSRRYCRSLTRLRIIEEGINKMSIRIPTIIILSQTELRTRFCKLSKVDGIGFKKEISELLALPKKFITHKHSYYDGSCAKVAELNYFRVT